MATKVVCLLCKKQGKETILSSLDNGMLARNYQEELMAVGKAMANHMDSTHNKIMVAEIQAIPHYNAFNVMKYFDEQIPEGRPLVQITNPITNEKLEGKSEFNYMKEFLRTQFTEQIMQCSPEMDEEDDDLLDDEEELEENDEDLEDEDEIESDDEPDFEDAEDSTDNEPCTVCGCNPCDCIEDDDEEDDED